MYSKDFLAEELTDHLLDRMTNAEIIELVEASLDISELTEIAREYIYQEQYDKCYEELKNDYDQATKDRLLGTASN